MEKSMEIKEGKKLIMEDGEHLIKDFIVLHNPFTLEPRVCLVTEDGIRLSCDKFVTKDGECIADVAQELINPFNFERRLAIRTKEGKVYQQEEIIAVETNTIVV
jgi:hypothetical protein